MKVARSPGGGAESLSLPQAAAILMYECTRQNLKPPVCQGPMTTASPSTIYQCPHAGVLHDVLLFVRRGEYFPVNVSEGYAMEGFIQVIRPTDSGRTPNGSPGCSSRCGWPGASRSWGRDEHLRWRGKIETAGEWLCLIKTSRSATAMEQAIARSTL